MGITAKQYADMWVEGLEEDFITGEIAYASGGEVETVDDSRFKELLLEDADRIVDEIEDVLYRAVNRAVAGYLNEMS